tara:strand:- start:258 stop:887 length:630 start_codon:yes stop_codon:yes gene_type:complete
MALRVEDIVKYIEKDDPVILEIGANVGKDTSRFLKTFSRVSLYCFEPDPRCIKKFKRRVNDTRCNLIKKAVSDKDGEKVFYLSSGHRPGKKAVHINSSSLLEPKEHGQAHPWCVFKNTTKVKTTRLDTWFVKSGLNHIDFIWADMQGAESLMIEGGKKSLSVTDYLYMEFSDDELYKGQPNLYSLLALVPNFVIEKKYKHNVLLKRYDK